MHYFHVFDTNHQELTVIPTIYLEDIILHESIFEHWPLSSIYFKT